MHVTNRNLLRFITRGMGRAVLYTAVALFAAAPHAAAADAGSNVLSTTITGIEELTGKTLSELKTNASTAGTYSYDDMRKVFFIYNVKTGKFLNAGGYWGTHVSMKETPLSFWVNTTSSTSNVIDFAQNMENGEGHLVRWSITGTDAEETDKGVFIDRSKGTNATGYYGWTLEAVSGDSKNTYKLYTYQTKSPSSSSIKYYLCANGDETDQDKNCEAYSATEINSNNLSGYDEWRIFSMQQIFDLQDQNTDDMTGSIELSFKLKCPGFSRNNKDITNWNIEKFSSSGQMRFGLEKFYSTTATTDKDYKITSDSYTFNGTTYSASASDSKKNYQRDLGKYFCADAKNVRGMIYQDVVVKHGGSYVVECKGYSNTQKAKLFAVLYKDDTEVENTEHQTVFSQIGYMSSTEQDSLHTLDQNMDYAGKSFYGSHKYMNTVLVHVPEVTTSSSDDTSTSYYTIRFGVIIGDDKNDTSVNGTDEWTVFDDFRLLYASNTIDEDLILDEDRADLSYLSDCSNTYKNKVLHLNKTFTRDKWNSFVLPVNLTVDQLRQAFGSNARLAKLSSLTSSEIQFTTVNLDELGTSDIALEAYTPYIIFPTRYIAPNESPAYKALLTKTGNQQSQTVTVIVKKNCVEIPNVTFATKTAEGTTTATNDLDNIDTSNWTTKKMYNVTGNGTMTAYGTFVRTFGPNNTTQGTDENSDNYGLYSFGDDKGTIISGRDDLKGSYFFWQGNLYCSSTRVRGLRGFSCWFKPSATTTDAAKMTMFIDGVAQDATTDISDHVAFGKEEAAGKAAQGVFTLSGQRISDTAGLDKLPAGMYIVNGKKYMVE